MPPRAAPGPALDALPDELLSRVMALAGREAGCGQPSLSSPLRRRCRCCRCTPPAVCSQLKLLCLPDSTQVYLNAKHRFARQFLPRRPCTSLVSKRWNRLAFAEPALWRQLTFSSASLAALKEPAQQERWFACKLRLLQRVAPLVEHFTLHDPRTLTAFRQPPLPGAWQLGDLLQLLQPSSLRTLRIACGWPSKAEVAPYLAQHCGGSWDDVLSAVLSQAPNLDSLELSGLRGSPIPASVLSSTRLTSLNLDSNRLEALPEAPVLAGKQAVVRHACCLTLLPGHSKMFSPFHCKSPHLCLPCAVQACGFNLEGSNFVHLPPALSTATSLQRLLLSRNPQLQLVEEDIAIFQCMASLQELSCHMLLRSTPHLRCWTGWDHACIPTSKEQLSTGALLAWTSVRLYAVFTCFQGRGYRLCHV